MFVHDSRLRFRPDFVGFLRPDTDPAVAATCHPWPGAARSASCLASPGSAPELSRHLRRTLRRQCHRDRKAFFQLSCDAPRRMQFWTLCVLLVALCVTQRFGKVSDVCLRLKAPFRPSATDFEGSK
ncbi:hypothetical protein CTI48_31335 [Pseudomonas syringae pv. actinidiae]|nr:hypothetical protein B1F85_22610 [Pseudomonas syringae pv. actinidiae]PIH84947.1 hypothetical protein CTI51_25895 [Pseudomonas syringae pv. actinidiae]PIH93026.1 hypothetical protein CTI48_31335 [Pseudomonas syringae pv. actinidiae]